MERKILFERFIQEPPCCSEESGNRNRCELKSDSSRGFSLSWTRKDLRWIERIPGFSDHLFAGRKRAFDAPVYPYHRIYIQNLQIQFGSEAQLFFREGPESPEGTLDRVSMNRE